MSSVGVYFILFFAIDPNKLAQTLYNG